MYIETTDIILSAINNVKKYLQRDGGGRYILCRMFLFLFLTDRLDSRCLLKWFFVNIKMYDFTLNLVFFLVS